MVRLPLIYMSLIVLISVGCKSTIHQDHSYENAEANLGELSVYANLRGTDKIDENRNSTRSSPYELWLSIESDELVKSNECYVKLQNVKIENTAANISLLVSSNEKLTFSTKKNTSKAFKIFKELEIPYEQVSLGMFVSLSSNCGANSFSESVLLQFSKNYSERKITFWDTLMGI